MQEMGTKTNQALSLSDHPKWEKNPFVEKAIQQIDRVTTTRMQFINPTSDGARKAIVNRQGEIEGETAFLRYIRKDEEQFTKIYVNQVALWAELTKAGANVFAYIMKQLRKDSDTFIFKLEHCLKETNYKSKRMVYLGLADLIEKGIIARTKFEFEYFINPLIAFNGSRVTFATTYVKNRQLELFPGEEEHRVIESSF